MTLDSYKSFTSYFHLYAILRWYFSAPVLPGPSVPCEACRVSSERARAAGGGAELYGGVCSHSESPETAEECKSTPRTLPCLSPQQPAWPARCTAPRSVSHQEDKKKQEGHQSALLYQENRRRNLNTAEKASGAHSVALSGRLHAGQVGRQGADERLVGHSDNICWMSFPQHAV